MSPESPNLVLTQPPEAAGLITVAVQESVRTVVFDPSVANEGTVSDSTPPRKDLIVVSFPANTRDSHIAFGGNYTKSVLPYYTSRRGKEIDQGGLSTYDAMNPQAIKADKAGQASEEVLGSYQREGDIAQTREATYPPDSSSSVARTKMVHLGNLSQLIKRPASLSGLESAEVVTYQSEGTDGLDSHTDAETPPTKTNFDEVAGISPRPERQSGRHKGKVEVGGRLSGAMSWLGNQAMRLSRRGQRNEKDRRASLLDQNQRGDSLTVNMSATQESVVGERHRSGLGKSADLRVGEGRAFMPEQRRGIDRPVLTHNNSLFADRPNTLPDSKF